MTLNQSVREVTMGLKGRLLGVVSAVLLLAGADAAVISDLRPPADVDLKTRLGELLSDIREVSPELRVVIKTYNAGNIIAAKERLTRILQNNPEDPIALHVAGTIFMQEGRYPNAQVAFEAALKSGARNDPNILAKLGTTRLLMGDGAKGERILRLAHRLDGNNFLALRYLAWLAERGNRFDEAAGYYGRLAELHQGNGTNPFLVAEARVLNKGRRHEDAARILGSVAGDDNTGTTATDKAAVAQLVDAYIKSGALSSAEKRLAGARKNGQIDPLQASVFELELAVKRDNHAAAKQLVESSIASYPDAEPAIRATASRAYTDKRDLPRAIEQMKGAVAYLQKSDDREQLFSASNDLAALYVRADRRIDALRLMNKMVKTFPDEPKPAYQLAEIQTSIKQFSAANQTLDGLIRKHPNFFLAHYLKGVIARRQKQYTQADQWLRKASQLQPAFEQAWVQRAGNMVDAGRPDGAIDVLARSVELNPSNPSLWFEYGALLTATGKHKAAIAAYESVLEIIPNHLPSIDNLAGEFLLLEDRPVEALRYALTAVQMDPNDPVLQLNYLEALYQNGLYDDVITNGKKVESGFADSARFQFLLGASYIEAGASAEGEDYLQRAQKQGGLDQRYVSKLARMLK